MADGEYDPSWDCDYGEDRYDESAFDRKYAAWENRDWMDWSRENLTFSFQSERMEDSRLDMFAPEKLHAKNPGPHRTP